MRGGEEERENPAEKDKKKLHTDRLRWSKEGAIKRLLKKENKKSYKIPQLKGKTGP